MNASFVASRPLPTRGRVRLATCPRRVVCVAEKYQREGKRVQVGVEDVDGVTEGAVGLAEAWVARNRDGEKGLLGRLVSSDGGMRLVMRVVDWVVRSGGVDVGVAGSLFSRVVGGRFVEGQGESGGADGDAKGLKKDLDDEKGDGLEVLNVVDRALLKAGAAVVGILPEIVVYGIGWRVRGLVGGFVGDVRDVVKGGKKGRERNVNLLGEAVLGEEEAARRGEATIDLLRGGGIEYVSVKVSGVTSQLNRWDFEGSLARVKAALRPVFEEAKKVTPRAFIALDMEEYHDLEITVAAFTALLDEPQFSDMDAGIVLQTYLPDALPALQHLVSWAHARPGNASIKIRLVKGANLAMEKVDADIHGWEQAPYTSKADTDANYVRCLEWVLTPERTRRVRIGVASHNLFLLAFAHLLSVERGVGHRIGFEMLQGMAVPYEPTLAAQGHGLLLYTPVCDPKDFDVAISYLFRRFEETSAEGNYLRSALTSLAPGSASFVAEERRFRAAIKNRDQLPVGPRRTQPRPAPAAHASMSGVPAASSKFMNEPDTDPALPDNRAWARSVVAESLFSPPAESSKVATLDALDAVFERARGGAAAWGRQSREHRCAVLCAVADRLAARRGDLINAMVVEGGKTFAEADSEASEAIDFAMYYGKRAADLFPESFEPLGTVCVAAPWNYPVAIAGGGVYSALAAGNAVILKPSSKTPRCTELVAECAWEAGVPRDVLQYVQCPARDVGKELIVRADAVILTGGSDTAAMFQSWKPTIKLFAETSGKNSLVISPAADLDLAVADLVGSAFSSSGQKCSASSLAICIGAVYKSPRFLRQLIDAAETIKVGWSTDLSTIMGPLIAPPNDRLHRALTQLDEGESWLLEPRCLDQDGEGILWTPGIRLGVRPGSWFHRNEIFGPVLGVMYARDLEHALELQNSGVFGLTGGLHSLDPDEIDRWVDGVEVGNAYVNRGTTGAIVQRQPFGGWKLSCVGPGAKAGGPNYVMQLGRISEKDGVERDEAWLAAATASDEHAWRTHFTVEHDPSCLGWETNVFRYRPLARIAVRLGPGSNAIEARRVRAAIARCGVTVAAWSDVDADGESAESFAARLANLGVARVRVLGEMEPALLGAAAAVNVHLADNPVVADGRIELLHYLREQAVSRTRHRFGNLV